MNQFSQQSRHRKPTLADYSVDSSRFLGSSQSLSSSETHYISPQILTLLGVCVQLLDFFTTFCSGFVATNFYKSLLATSNQNLLIFLRNIFLKYYILYASKVYVPTESILYAIVETHIFKNQGATQRLVWKLGLDMIGEFLTKFIFCNLFLWVYNYFFDWKGFIMQFLKITICFLGQNIGTLVWTSLSYKLHFRHSHGYRKYISRKFYGIKSSKDASPSALPR